MTSSRRVAFAFVLSVVGVACATSTAPIGGGGTQEGPGGGDAGIIDAAGGYGWGGEGGGPTEDSGTPIVHKDSGTVTPIDSGTVVTPVDSGTTTPDFCTGSTSGYDGSSYTSWCTYDYEYNDPHNDAFTCSSNDDCQTHGVPGCCFKPKSSSNCYSDYGGVPQCVPQ